MLLFSTFNREKKNISMKRRGPCLGLVFGDWQAPKCLPIAKALNINLKGTAQILVDSPREIMAHRTFLASNSQTKEQTRTRPQAHVSANMPKKCPSQRMIKSKTLAAPKSSKKEISHNSSIHFFPLFLFLWFKGSLLSRSRFDRLGFM